MHDQVGFAPGNRRVRASASAETVLVIWMESLLSFGVEAVFWGH
jgi:hypothetical protein